MPTILAAYIRRRKGQQPIPPDPALGHAANVAQMTWGDQQDPRSAAVLNTCFILQAEHGLNASTFVARTVTSTNADMHAAATAALGALKGPLHGGATDGTMKMLDEIGTPEHVAAWVEKAIASKYKFSGFGHRVYKTHDPRAPHLRRFSQGLAKTWKGPKYFEIQEQLAEGIAKHRPSRSPAAPGKGNVVNVDYPPAPPPPPPPTPPHPPAPLRPPP